MPCLSKGAPAIDTPAGTLDVVRRIVNGELYPFVPLFGYGIVDLDDVCQAHVMGMIKRETTGRYLIDYECYPSFLLTIADMLRARYGKKYRLPKWSLPRWFGPIFKHVIGPMMGVEKAFVDAHYGGQLKFDSSPAVNELGVTFHSPKAGLEETVEYLIRKGALSSK
jgi:nucleoside-diphosphate-sugar epimerase